MPVLPARRSPVATRGPVAAAAVCLALVSLAAPALGQRGDPRPTQRLRPVGEPAASASTTEERSRAFRSLAADVEALDAYLGIVKRVARLVAPSVVHIEAKAVSAARRRSGDQEAGSGVVVSFRAKPYVLTNRHVIRFSAPTHIDVHLQDRTVVKPSRMWHDRQTDVAILAFDEDAADGLTPALLGRSARVEIGEQVLAFGSPFGLSHSVTRGIVSATGRYNLDLGDGEVALQNFLQTDAAINPGNSGGPLVNLRGEVIGLNTAIASSSGGNEGIGFSIPIDLATRIAGQLIDNGEATRGYLGVEFDPNFNERRARLAGLTRFYGALITRVKAGSPAETAALKAEDILVNYDGVAVEDYAHLFNLVNLTEVGKRVEVELVRNGRRLRATVPIGRRPAEDLIR